MTKKNTTNQKKDPNDEDFRVKTLIAISGLLKDSERKTNILDDLSDNVLVIMENLKNIKEKIEAHSVKISDIENQLNLISLMLDGIQERDVLVSNNHVHLKEIKYAIQGIKDKLSILAFEEEKNKEKKQEKTKMTLARLISGFSDGIKDIKAILGLITIILSLLAYFFGGKIIDKINPKQEKNIQQQIEPNPQKTQQRGK